MNNSWAALLLLGCVFMTACSTGPADTPSNSQQPVWLVSPSSAGQFRLGMTVVQVRDALDSEYELVEPRSQSLRTPDADGPALNTPTDLYAIRSPEGEKILEFLMSDPSNPEAPGNRIVMISAVSPRFSTTDGVRPGDRIARVVPIYGPVSLLNLDPEGLSREWAVFRNGPPGMRFEAVRARGVSGLAGIYDPSSPATSSFAPDSQIRALVIGSR